MAEPYIPRQIFSDRACVLAALAVAHMVESDAGLSYLDWHTEGPEDKDALVAELLEIADHLEEEGMKITDTVLKALRIVKDHPDIYPTRFAEKMWPDSPAWNRQTNVGNGSAAGVGIKRSGGCYLAKLKKAGLVWESISCRGSGRTYRISGKGTDLLR